MAKRWQDWMMLLIGFWLLVSPFLLMFPGGFGSHAATNSYLVGVLLVVINVVALARPAVWQEWVNLIIGTWLLLVVFVIGTEQRIVMWNNLIAGLVVVLGAISALNWIRIRPEQ